MADNALRQAFREVLSDPALLLIELAWRWTFGLISTGVCLSAAFLVLGSVPFDAKRLRFLWISSPWQAAQSLSFTLLDVGRKLLLVGVLAALLLAIFWVCLSAWGRYATLERPALGAGATLRACFGISAVRAGITLAALCAWMLAGALAGLLGSATAVGVLPNPVVILTVLLPALALILTGWSFFNWYLSLAPLFVANDWKQSAAAAWSMVRQCSDQVLEISMAIGLLRALLFVIALVLSFAAAAVIRSERILICDLIAISLLYFAAGDFLYLFRLVAYAQIRDEFPVKDQHSIPSPGLSFIANPASD